MEQQVRRNLFLINLTAALFGLRLFEGVLVVYVTLVTGSYTMGMTYFAILNLSASAFEVPTGLWSDRVGRRLTLIAHYFFGLLSVTFIAFAANDLHIIAGAALAGLSVSLRSGTKQAYIYENLELIGETHLFKKVIGRMQAYNRYASTAGALLGALAVYWWGMEATLYVTLVPLTGALVASLFFTEVQSSKTGGNSIYEDIAIAWQQFRTDAVLRDLSLGRLLATGWGNVEWRFRSLFFATFLPLWTLNLLDAFNKFATGLIMHLAHRATERLGNYTSLIKVGLLNRLVVIIGIVLGNIFGAIAMSISTATAYGLREVVGEELLQTRYTKEQRATMGSLVGLAGNLAYAFLAIGMGVLADLWGIVTTMLVLQVCLFIPIWFFSRGLAQISSNPPPQQSTD